MDNCEELQKVIDEELSGLFKKEKRFMSHLTIARVKDFENKKKFLDELRKIEISKIRFCVDNFRLKKSVLNSKRVKYGTLEGYRLV